MDETKNVPVEAPVEAPIEAAPEVVETPAAPVEEAPAAVSTEVPAEYKEVGDSVYSGTSEAGSDVGRGFEG